MSTTTPGPRVEAIRQHVQASYAALNRLIDGPLATLDTVKLYEHPLADEWSIMENLAHIIEFLPYWANEIAKLVATPGQKFGRTAEDEGRLRGIREHSTDTLEQVKAQLPGSYARLDQVLASLKDSDLDLQGRHPKYGDQRLEWFIRDFVAEHLAAHVEQIKGTAMN